MVYHRDAKPILTVLFSLYCLALPGCDAPGARELSDAAVKGDTATIDRLIEGGTDVDAQLANGDTALVAAIENNRKSAYTALLEGGANPNILNRDGNAAVHLAAEHEDSFWLREALKHGANPDLVNKGNWRVPGWTPIFYAIGLHRKENVKLLIDAGADLDHKNGAGEFPAFKTATGGKFEMLYALHDAGADFNATNRHGTSTVDWINLLDEGLVMNKNEVPWFHKVRELLKEKGVQLDE